MKKPIVTVFLIIAVLVFCLVIWGSFFNTGGVLETAWNAVVTPVNKTWQGVVGDTNAKLVPEMTIKNQKTDNLSEDNKKGGGAGN